MNGKIKRMFGILIGLIISVYSFNVYGITLSPGNSHVVENKSGTVTFNGPGLTLEEVAKRENLRNISGRTYQAALIYSVSFSRSGVLDSRGKIFNCTDKNIVITCSFYNGNRLIASYRVQVKARTFSRMVPSDVSMSVLENCNRIVCSE